jgi:hypothetical protein
MSHDNAQRAHPLDSSNADQSRGAGGFKRAYKACEACRRTKNKCEVNGDSVACTRCVRERRECVFPLTRSNKRARRSSYGTSSSNNVSIAPSARMSQPGPTSGTATGSAEHEQRAMPDRAQQTRPDDLQTEVVKTFVTSSNDAMGLLFQAAEENESDSDTDRDASNGRVGNSMNTFQRRDDFSDAAASPWISSEAQLPPQLTRETLAVWNKHRFVMQGWFSAFEAISYVEL